MSLKSRLSLGVALLAALVVVGFGGTAYVLFVREQQLELRRLLNEDLARVASLLDRPVLGASFVDASAPGVIVQIVSEEGRVVLSWGDDGPLPGVSEPAIREIDGRRFLVTGAPWRGGGGTVRLAHDVEGAFAARRRLLGTLFAGGTLTFLVASLLAIVVARRAVGPLERLAERAREVDPSAPETIEYVGRSEEIRSVVTALNDTLGAIRDRKRDEQAFLLEIAHELASPLTLVNYHLAELRAERPDEERVRAAADASRELLRTSQDLLVLARGELERPLTFSVLSLGALAEQVAREYPGIGLVNEEAGEIVADADRLMQVLRNLVRNAVQATGRPEDVLVEVRTSGDEHLALVRDRGPGLDHAAVRRVFERGYRSGTGVGVGLTICKAIVEQHGGSIAVSSEPGRGTSFEVRLPSLASRLDAGGEGGVDDADDAQSTRAADGLGASR